jgi:adenine phosphoribosyltransferase
VRKAGKLPRPAASVSYALEYGRATVEVHDDLAPGARVLVVDDVLATGGTLAAAHALFAELGQRVVGTAVLMELEQLGGRALVGDVHTVFRG